ncbi:dysbindin like protein [Danaus plexippus plexippus]|uniref:Dysbindin domain-containing protein 1 n=1 Tax=Danaus plexippus plexippus TaxID=278856 RepID=A0A212EXM4_DANPL|nr:dysbindin like protein [Danaus plexippus plexippus]
MLGNIKEFISVVQDGLASNNNLRQTLQEVQKVKNIFKDRQKVSSGTSDSKVNYGAGSVLLEKYQTEWAELHENADKNAKAADAVDKVIIEIHETTNSKLQNATELAQNLALLPSLTVSVAQCVESLKNIQTLLRDVENQLVEFEDIVERSNMEKWKLDHHYHLTLYKEKKMAGLEEIRNQLARENLEQSSEKEKQQLAQLQAKHEHSAVAFQVDMAKYLITGNIPNAPKPKPNITLEEIQLDDDQTDLEKFLES